MGLLDDAIREHLELKRLRGADPGDVAREEQAALGPVHREEEAEPNGPKVGNGGVSPTKDTSLLVPESADSRAPSSSSQETVEINMEAELATEEDSESEGHGGDRTQEKPIANPGYAQTSSEESLEWEMPGDREDEAPRRSGSQAEIEAQSEHERDQPVEDVLEETPDFLRDTPEQERLWFEQRPPRDFDFDE